MHALVRKLFFGCATLLPLAAALSPVLNAQNATEDGPPKVLVIHRNTSNLAKAARCMSAQKAHS